MNWEYLTLADLRLCHADRIREHGGAPECETRASFNRP